MAGAEEKGKERLSSNEEAAREIDAAASDPQVKSRSRDECLVGNC